MLDVLLGSYNSIRVVQMMAENQTRGYCNGLKEKEFWISGQILFFQKHETKLYSIILFTN